MRLLTTCLFLTLTCCALYAQTFSSPDPAYIDAVTAGEAELKAENYEDCLSHYATAFEIKQTSFLSTLRAAACAYSAGKADLLTLYLDRAFELSPEGTQEVYDDYEEFRYLDGTDFEQTLDRRFLVAFPNYDKALAARLAEVGRLDQEQRRYMRTVSDEYGWQSPQMDSLWAIQNVSDSLNTIYITQLIDEIGYPGKSLVGGESRTAFLVIQHADLEIQEQYLPILREAAEADELRWASLALLIDRIEMRNDRPQIYGSQVKSDPETKEHYFAEIKDPHNVDKIRAEVGLGPIQGYADNWNFTFDPVKHLERHAKE